MRVIAVTSVEQSMSAEPGPGVGSRLLDEADLVIDLCTPHADALVEIDGLETPVGPGSTIAAVAIVNCIKVRTAQLLVERGAMPPVITRASVVGAERSRELFDDAYREHAQRITRAIIRGGMMARTIRAGGARTDVSNAPQRGVFVDATRNCSSREEER